MKYYQVLQIVLVLFIGIALSAKVEETEQSHDNNEILVLTSNDLSCYSCVNNSKDPECSCESSKCLLRTRDGKAVNDRRCTDERWVNELLFDGCITYKNETWCVCSSNYCNGGDVNSIRGSDDCSADPCPSGSACLDTREGFKCMCPPWEKTCTYSAPAGSPCENGGFAVRLPSGNLACSCAYGFSGRFCQTRDPCAPNPCMNSGSCYETFGRPQCNCRQGFQGDLCQVCDACSPNPCNNGGYCLPDGLSGFICRCPQGTTGRTCDYQTAPPQTYPPQTYPPQTQPPQTQPRDPCNPNPCRNGGRGIAFGDICYCQCPPNWTGQNCEVLVAPPTTVPPTTRQVQTTQIPCRPNYNPCWNGGQVVQQGPNCYCYCQHHFTGPYCQHQTQPPVVVTQPPVVVTRPPTLPTVPPTLPPQTYRPPQNPQQPQNPCQPNPCWNGGYGIPYGPQCYCQCPPQYTGPNCQQQTQPPVVVTRPPTLPTAPPTLPPTQPPQSYPPQTLPPVQWQCRPNYNPCWNGGYQVQMNGNCYCQCPPSFSGPICNVQTRPPPPPQTQPPQTYPPQTQPPQTYPPQTPSRNPCQPNPCQNGGYPIPYGQYCYCQCVPLFTGYHCEHPVTTPAPPTTQTTQTTTQPTTRRNPCDPNPCLNGGLPYVVGDVCVCSCPPGYTGQNCQTPLTTPAPPTTQTTTQPQTQPATLRPCNPNPCWNGGHVVPYGNNCYCVCVPVYTGPYCQQRVTNPPVVVTPPPTLPTLPPTLPPQTLPPQTYRPPQNPQQPQNPCNPNPCWNGGSCYQWGYRQCGCVCPPRYTGQYCNHYTAPPTLPTAPPTLPPTQPPQTYRPPQNPPQNPQQPPQQWYNPCQPNPCYNYGRCVPMNNYQYQCQCGSAWSGNRCQYSKK